MQGKVMRQTAKLGVTKQLECKVCKEKWRRKQSKSKLADLVPPKLTVFPNKILGHEIHLLEIQLDSSGVSSGDSLQQFFFSF